MRWMVAPLLRRGYTIFAVSHLSQPQATVMEIVADVHRGVRFIRHHAKEYGIDPNRIGVAGGSAGGHLSLMLATRGGPGVPDANDPVDRESSAVQAAAVFFPVTDLLNLGDSTENPGDGGPPKSFVKAFGPRSNGAGGVARDRPGDVAHLPCHDAASTRADLPRRCRHAGAAGAIRVVRGPGPRGRRRRSNWWFVPANRTAGSPCSGTSASSALGSTGICTTIGRAS